MGFGLIFPDGIFLIAEKQTQDTHWFSVRIFFFNFEFFFFLGIPSHII